MSSLYSILLWNTLIAGALGSVIFLLQRLTRLKSHAGLFHFLWLLVLVKLAMPPVFTLPIAWSPVQEGVKDFSALQPSLLLEADSINVAPLQVVVETSAWSWPPQQSLLAIALFGAIVFFLVNVFRVRKIAQLVRLARPGPTWLQNVTDSLAAEMDIRPSIPLLVLDGCVSPFLWVGRRGPTIVVPATLISELNRESLQLVIKHELTHYNRRDHWTNAFVSAIGILFWWNPVAWWARRELRFVQELCCDASVLASDTRHRRLYAETLLQAVDFVASEEASYPVATTAYVSCSTFKRRMEMISQRDLSSRTSLATRWFVLPLGALLIATSPVTADEDHGDELAGVRVEVRELKEDELADVRVEVRELKEDELAEVHAEVQADVRVEVRELKEAVKELRLIVAKLADKQIHEQQKMVVQKVKRGNERRMELELEKARKEMEKAHKEIEKAHKEMEKAHKAREKASLEHELARKEHEKNHEESVKFFLNNQQIEKIIKDAHLSKHEVELIFEIADKANLKAEQLEQLLKSKGASDQKHSHDKKILFFKSSPDSDETKDD